MFLKRLELVGFKSFADKTELEFARGINGVVGPNGSGKSNISDAIRWVLGEQSARSLRGGHMQDVIFAGSDSRKAVNYSEVSITLDNADQTLPLDFSEVTVTRRLHRNGESEYFINKQPCRLKDIVELFMDTGIGKEAYSIIGQGRIEEILSSRSEDRRGVFEEASGIVKYKTRKKEAEKKLAETEQNLLRIHDLISELEGQIEPLRQQSETAKKYKALKEQLKATEISLYVHQIERIHGLWSEANEKLSALQNEQLELSAVVSRHDAQLEKERMEARRLEEEIESLHETELRLSEEFEKCEGYGEVLKERGKNLRDNLNRLTQTIELQQRRIDEKRAEMDTYRQKHEQLERQQDELHKQLKAEEERLTGVAGEAALAEEERLKAELLETLNRIAQHRNEIRYAEQHAESLTRRMERANEEKTKWSDALNDIAERRQQLQLRAKRLAEELEQSRNLYLEAARDVQAKKEQLGELQDAARKWEQKIDALTSRRDTMREMQNDYDGFASGVKEVLRAKNKPGGLKGIHGAVAELIQVPAEVETAVETALGGALQHIVVENEAAGREAIAFLKRKQAGRATLLPLDVISARSISAAEQNAVASMDGYVGIAAQLVRFADVYRNIVFNLLGNVIVARTLEDANRIAAKCQYRYRVVTLEGDVVNPGGSMTGGSLPKKTVSLLGRQRQIDELDAEIRNAEAQLSRLRENFERLKRDITDAERELEQLRQSGERLRMAELEMTSEIQRLDSESKTAEEQLAICDQDCEALARERDELEQKKREAAEALARAEAEEGQLQQAIRAAEEARKQSESVKEELQAQLTALKVKAASLAQEKQSVAEQLRRFGDELSAAEQEWNLNKRTAEQLHFDLEENERESVRQIERLNELRIKKQEAAEAVEYKRAERAKLAQRLEQNESLTKERRARLKQVEDQLRQKEVHVNRLDVELDNLLKKLAEEYELGFELAKERYPVPDDVPAAQNRAKELKRDIAALGEVNLGAIDEFERVNERHAFLSAQRNDLVEAKETLYRVIKEMDEEMSKRFKTTFEAIREQFVVVFSKLFGGGRADLVLSEPDRVLDTGVDIIAQPPGKKLQNLQLLSGGERALTAIALLFAILRVKPVPFCVLDEVEAALDEANVARFADYLREFSQDTQFIVVTHRKGTMEAADVLYGVTMEEGGVSKLVSVRLDDEDAISA